MKASFDLSRVQEFANSTDELIGFFVDLIKNNGKVLYKKMITRFVAKPIMENPHKDLTEEQRHNKARCVLKAYQIWGCGAYLQKQRVFAGADQNSFLGVLWDGAYKMFDSQELNLYFETVKFYENDKFRQGAEIIGIVLEIYDVINYRLYLDDKFTLKQQLLPLSEFFLGCLAAMIEKYFRPEKMHEKTRDFYQYLGLVEENFSINKAELKRIAGI